MTQYLACLLLVPGKQVVYWLLVHEKLVAVSDPVTNDRAVRLYLPALEVGCTVNNKLQGELNFT
jgi:hypothetical protein